MESSQHALSFTQYKLLRKLHEFLNSISILDYIIADSRLMIFYLHFYFVVVIQLLTHAQVFVIPWTAAHQASLSFTIYHSLLKLMCIESVRTCSHLIISCPILLLPSIFPSIRVYSDVLALQNRVQSIGVAASASVLATNIHGWFPLGWTDLISLQPKGLSSVYSSTTIQKHQYFGAQPSLWSNSHIHRWLLEKR